MLSTVSVRGQTAIPAEIRKRYGIKPHSRLQWIDNGRTITVVPIADDPIAVFRGKSKGKGLTEALLRWRKEERARENGSRQGS
ncbi:MAG TPA: AbrB/MazE/SpoVT family DNA-binding domain-containing protein [Candidatus Latescibacteria bacterium]|nr:AbrB/MazE/SpoVT family DNA-binding domain-containing protein [Candidatus Latescibacterota bacterium]